MKGNPRKSPARPMKIKKALQMQSFKYLILLEFFGRGEKIRTSDPLHPMQVRYQAALRPDSRETYSKLLFNFCQALNQAIPKLPPARS